MAEPAGEPRGGRMWWWIGFAILLAYVAWMIGPYLRSVVVRDAAVTTWVHVANAPIYGRVDQKLPALGSAVGTDGVILRIHNERVDRTGVEGADAEIARAEAAVAELTARVAALRALDAERQDLTRRYSDALTRWLAIEVAGAERELAFINERLGLVRGTAERKDALARKGNTPRSEADEAQAEVAALELQRVEQEKRIERARLRQDHANRGVFLAEDGTDPDWAFRSRDAVRLELARTEGLLADAQAVLAKARVTAAAEQADFAQASEGTVEAPPGSRIWSLIVGAGAAVDVGAPVAQWIDCSVLLVDVPVADVQLALLQAGMPAEVVFEGESTARAGQVLLTRGAAATLGATDLAAVAKGRSAGIGQVILSLEPASAAEGCAVGRAAFVDFPDVGMIDVVRSRLRL
jgi:multidrug resistance efflux pump